MPKIPLPKGYDGESRLPHTHTNLQNCFNNGKGQIIGMPGISQLNTTGGVARGQFEWRGGLYQVSSTNLIKITDVDTGAYSVIGTIDGPQPIETAIGFNHAVIIVRGAGGKSYTLDASDTLTDTSGNANFESFQDVCHINGRFVYIPADGSVAAFSDVGDGATIGASSFFDAEELPDLNNAAFNLNNTLYIAGTDSIELFRDTGADPNPFTRVPGGSIRTGYIGGLLEHENTFFFVGRKRGHNPGIFAISQGEAVKISNNRVDEALSSYTSTELEEAISGRLIWNGYDIATFVLREDSFGFLGGQWFKLDSRINGESRPWAGGYITEFNGSYYTAYSGKIGKFAQVNTHYGERIVRRIAGGALDEKGDWFTVQSMELGLSQGYNSASGSVALRMSKDNVQYGPPIFRNTGGLGEYSKRLKWNPPGGLGKYEKFFGYEIYTAEDIEFSADSMLAEYR